MDDALESSRAGQEQRAPANILGSGATDGELIENVKARLGNRSLVLIGIMGSGKSTVGKRLAQRLGLGFVDADTEIERAANMSIPEIFDAHGEAYFRSGEERVIARLLQEGPQVLATGGGAFMSEETRQAIKLHGVSIWMKADLPVLMARVRRRQNRPLLRTPDPEATMRDLMDKRHPVYAMADLTVHSRDVPHEAVVDDIMSALSAELPALALDGETRGTSVS